MSKDSIYITEDGSHSVQSGKFDVSYHSKYGAAEETYHVFINAALRFKAVVQKNINILDIGFGTGLNAFVSLLEAEKRNLNISYTAIEAYPLHLEQVQLLNYPSLLNPDFEEHFLRMHQSDWEQPIQISKKFEFKKHLKRIEDLDSEEEFDIIYFDAFAPSAQPELWTEPVLQKMYTALKRDGILTTYCAKGVVKRTLKKVGFTVEALPGPPHKREMTRALKV